MGGRMVCSFSHLRVFSCWSFLAASAPSSPMKNRPSSSVLKAVSSSSVSRNADSIYAASRSFDDRSKPFFSWFWVINSFILVPVYDGRARDGRPPFLFTDSDFNNLSSWPLYRKGTSDIPVDSIVSVGYTLSTYKGTSGTILSSNIHFVILISIPAIV